MAEFEQLRDELAAGRLELKRKRDEALLAREAIRQGERALEEFARAESPRHGQERGRLEQALEDARARARGLDEDLGRLRAVEAGRLKTFEVFTDPREQLRRWPDAHPILLFPLRLETRFKAGADGRQQLWVRVFPDTCLIESFEESLAEQEVANARAFWASVWRAGGDEALERAAWRELVASHGSGRAGWIVRRYVPLNPDDKPARDNPTDVLLVIVAPGPLPAAAGDYWQAAWRAGGDAGAERAAFAALELAVGAQRARDIVEQFRPFNFDDTPAAPRTRADVRVRVAVLQLTPADEIETRRTSWSSATRIELLPERFVLVATSRTGETRTEIGNTIRVPLVAGPDPNAPPEQQLKPVGDTLQIPDELAWMFDFEKALELGMAFRFDLTAEQAREGFERVVVVGLRLGDSPEQGARHLAGLLERHLHSRPGLEIVPQGTPTNNTEKGGSGYSFRDDPEATFDAFFRQRPLYALESEPLLRRDGQWLAELLGLPHELVQRIPHADGLDQSEARAMQLALWPGTLGYMMETQLAPVFSEPDVAATRAFFTRHVSGRGPLPALRIGPQPYGILPTTAFDRINWFRADDRLSVLRPSQFPARLYAILKRVDDDWKPLVARLSFVGKRAANPDPHQVLLDVLGLHPSSVEYYPLQAESVEHKFYELAFLNYSFALNLLGLFPAIIPLTLLRSLGYAGAEAPDLLNKVFKARQTPLNGPIVDDLPLSESEPVRKYAGDKNYIEWLVDAARTGFESLQQEQGFDGGKKPAALLYLLLRHALQLSFHATVVKLGVDAGVIADAATLRRDPPFVHVAERQAASESRYDLLFRADARVTQSADLTLTPVELPEDLDEPVNRRDKTPLVRDGTNGGLVHAPSINHATTAAVLRNGYLANDGRLAVDLSSRRVRLALGILEGMRNGQSLGALLGYQFERHVHDKGPLQVRDLVYHLRRQFPLAANQIVRTRTEAGEAREAVTALNVVDGRKMLDHAELAQNFTYPFGVSTLPRRAPVQEAAVTGALAHIREINDAVADLVLAEGVHQAVLGNYERSAGTLDAFSKGNYPPEPEVVRTPRSGSALTLRAAIHLLPAPPANPVPVIRLTPLAAAEPAVNAWLAGRLPPVPPVPPAPGEVGCRVSFTNRATNTEQTVFVTQRQLGLHPIDLVYRAEARPEQALGDLDDLILRHLHANHAPRHDRAILIRHTERVPGNVTFFELGALLRSLRPLVTASRPLQPADLMRANDATGGEQSAVSLDPGRLETPRDDLRGVLLPVLDALAVALGNPAVNIDDALSQFADAVGLFAAYRLPQTGTGFVFEWRAGAYAALAAKLAARVRTWDERLARYEARIDEYDALPGATPEGERFTKLQEAEIIISTRLTEPAPAAAADYRAALDARETAFVSARDGLQQLIDAPRATLAQLLDDARAELPLTDFDPDALDFDADDAEVTRFRALLTDAAARLKAEVLGRLDRVDAILAEHDAAGAADKVRLLQEGARPAGRPHAAPVALPARRAVARAGASRRPPDRRRPAALHRPLRRGVRPDAARLRPARRRVDGSDSGD
ncbi:MAG: hypothetical protein LC800_05505 [Acidobacteria bacterium]|nr:hypothetical protein [Acidobacteriota bacterium]